MGLDPIIGNVLFTGNVTQPYELRVNYADSPYGNKSCMSLLLGWWQGLEWLDIYQTCYKAVQIELTTWTAHMVNMSDKSLLAENITG